MPAPGMPAGYETAPPAEFVQKGDREEDVGEVTVERKIVRTGSLTLQVEDVVEAMDKVAEIAAKLDGYVVSSTKHENRLIQGYVSIRVPVGSFDEAFTRLRQLAIKVPHEETTARDITEEYVDLEARLRNLEATEKQYLAFLERAEKVEDMVAVQRELSIVRQQIEQIKGRMLYLERTSDMSRIEVTLQLEKPLTEPGWSASNALKTAVRGLTTFGRGLATLFIWLGVFCWIWIPILIFWRRRRRRAKL